MEYRIQKRQNTLYHHCTEVLRYTLEYPELDGYDELSSFFVRFADEYEGWLRGKLYEGLCVGGKNGNEARARRRKRRTLCARMTAAVSFGMGCVSVLFRITCGENTVTRSFSFNLEKSIAVKLTDFISKHEAKKFGEIFYIVNNTIYAIYKNGEISEIISDKFCKRQKTANYSQ